jgi:hypothetical protein
LRSYLKEKVAASHPRKHKSYKRVFPKVSFPLSSPSVINKKKVKCKKVIMLEQILSPASVEVELFLYFVKVSDDVFGGIEGLMLAYRSPFSVGKGKCAVFRSIRTN